MTAIGTAAVPGAGASAPAVRRQTISVFNTGAVVVTLTRRALESLLHMAVCREAIPSARWHVKERLNRAPRLPSSRREKPRT